MKNKISNFLKLTCLTTTSTLGIISCPEIIALAPTLLPLVNTDLNLLKHKSTQALQNTTRHAVKAASHAMYDLEIKGQENIPSKGPAILVANHVSFIDAVIIFGGLKRSAKFVMYYGIYKIPVLKNIFSLLEAVPIASKKENEKVFNESFEMIREKLSKGELVMIFPEGAITKDGRMAEFKPGLLKILSSLGPSFKDIPIIPANIDGLWGSMFSRKNKDPIKRLTPQVLKTAQRRKVGLNIGSPIYIKDTSSFDMNTLHSLVTGLGGTKDITQESSTQPQSHQKSNFTDNLLPTSSSEQKTTKVKLN